MQSYTIIFVAITVLISFWAFNDRNVVNKLLLYPKAMNDPSEYHRFLTHGFIHADYTHLIFNMIALFSIGGYVEASFASMGKHQMFLVLYLSGIVVASLPSYIKHRNNSYYGSLGASGGTSAVMFSMVYFAPWEQLRLFFIPMWSILFAILYIGYSAYMNKQQKDNIGHDAHLWGGVYGFFFTLLVDPSHGAYFLQEILHPPFLGR